MAINRRTALIQRNLMVRIGREADTATRRLTRAWSRAWDELLGRWTGGLQDAADLANRTGAWPATWEQARILRLQQALEATQTALSLLGTRTGVTVANGANNVIYDAARYEPRLIASQLPAKEYADAVARFSGNITPSALDAIVARTQSTIASRVQPLSRASIDAMRRELIKGIAVGDNPETVAKAMVDRVQGAFEGGLTRAVNIARTEMLDAYRTTAMHAHAANADVVSGWVWLAQLDDRCCPSCWSMHGRVFPVTQPGPWDHQQGRCARVPKTKTWRELGIDIDEPADTIPNARERFNALPRDKQLRIMGPERLRLLDNKTVSWDQLAQMRKNAGWRNSFAPRSVGDLRRGAGLSPTAPKPSTFARTPPKTVKPPVQPPSRNPVELTGNMSKTWWKALKDDTGFGHSIPVRNLVVSAAHPGAGIPAYIVKFGHAYRVDGISYLVESGGNLPARQIAEAFRDTYNAIPTAERSKYQQAYAWLMGRNPADAYWAQQYNMPGFESFAIARDGVTLAWNRSFSALGPGSYAGELLHEFGHNVSYFLDLSGHHSTPPWLQAAVADRNAGDRAFVFQFALGLGHKPSLRDVPSKQYPYGVTDYGTNSAAEDYAESVKLYLMGPIGTGRLTPNGPKVSLYFRDLWPTRAKLLDRIFPDVAKKQLAALRAR